MVHVAVSCGALEGSKRRLSDDTEEVVVEEEGSCFVVDDDMCRIPWYFWRDRGAREPSGIVAMEDDGALDVGEEEGYDESRMLLPTSACRHREEDACRKTKINQNVTRCHTRWLMHYANQFSIQLI